MVSIAILGHKNTNKEKILGRFIKYIKEQSNEEEDKEIFFLGTNSIDLKKPEQIITNKIVFAIKEIKDLVIVGIFNDKLDKSIIRLGNILLLEIVEKIVLVFSGKINIDEQFSFFEELIDYLPKYVYIILDGYKHKDIEKSIKIIEERLNVKNIKIRKYFEIFNIQDVLDELETSSEKKELIEERYRDHDMYDIAMKLCLIAKDRIYERHEIEIDGIIQDVEFYDKYGVYVDATTGEIRTFIQKIKWKMWNLLNTIDSLVEKRSFLDWIDTLPFPLASILWLYVSDLNIEHKIDHLLNFFEALSEFIVMIVLSSFKNDELFYEQNKNKWIEKDPRYRDWIKRPTFGSWNFIGRKLAKIVRSCINNTKKNDYINKFRLSEIFLKMISNKKLYSILERIVNWRNLWKGHGGVVNRITLKQRLLNLEEALTEIKKIIETHFTDVYLVLAGPNKKSGNRYIHQVKSIMGTRTPFKVIEIEILEAMDVEELYIICKATQKPLKIKFPFIRLETLEEEKIACYFYNRVEGNNLRYISYRLEQDPERFYPFKDFEEIISSLSYDYKK